MKANVSRLFYISIYAYAYVYMAKNIAVSDDVYELLSRLKLPNESFSDTIKRLAKKPKLSEIAGSKTVTKEEWAKVRETFRRQEEYDIRRKKSLLEGTR